MNDQAVSEISEISQEQAVRMLQSLEHAREVATTLRRALTANPSLPQINQANQTLATLAIEIGVVLRNVRQAEAIPNQDESGLTERQRVILRYIRDHKKRRGFSPSIREIGDYANIKSPNGVMSHLRALERKGWIHRGTHQARSIVLT